MPKWRLNDHQLFSHWYKENRPQPQPRRFLTFIRFRFILSSGCFKSSGGEIGIGDDVLGFFLTSTVETSLLVAEMSTCFTSPDATSRGWSSLLTASLAATSTSSEEGNVVASESKCANRRRRDGFERPSKINVKGLNLNFSVLCQSVEKLYKRHSFEFTTQHVGRKKSIKRR